MAREHPIDLEVREYRALQTASDTKTTRAVAVLLLLAAATLLLSLGIGILLLPEKQISVEENRPLATRPRLSAKALLSGEYTAALAKFYSDQFPLRDEFVAVKAASELLLLKMENNGVLIGRDGYLIDRLEYGTREYQSIDENLEAVEGLRAHVQAIGIPLVLAVAPRTVDVMPSAYPICYAGDRAAAAYTRIFTRFGEALDLSIPLRTRAEKGEYVAFRTDHHWTSLGVYYAYAALGESLGYEPLPLSSFTADTVTEEFLGTTYSRAGIKWASPDAITLYRGADDERYTVTVHESGESAVGFYRDHFLKGKDKYSVFLGGNHGRVSIKKAGDARPTLLLVKDSFALSLAPFLARHFDLELVDPRYYGGSVAALLTESGSPPVDRILVLVGIDTLASGSVLRRLLLGL